ncbi:MAG: flavodoxin family protein [Candidatus Omnitrophica bacterium]|nr:flavodoxin family protein [Candidatus Omnitrophota bacterium]
MKCLGILAGPRKGHATDRLIEAVLEGVKQSGGEVEKISLYDYNIKPCAGCSACQMNKKCPIEDDHHIILEKMEEADSIVFGSPAYWSNVTSEAKKFMDRSASFFEMTAFGPRRKKKKPSKIVLITTCGAPFPFSHLMGIIPGAVGAMKVFFGRMNAKVHVIYAAGMMDPAKSLPSEKLMRKARDLGKSL